jgi:DNA-binding CsgD family transcriptional regulator
MFPRVQTHGNTYFHLRGSIMPFWDYLLHRLGLPRSRHLSFQADEALIQSLRDLARDEHRSTEALAADLLAQAISRQRLDKKNLAHWQKLSLREQQVVSLMCLHYTTAQIAARLALSPETVKSHMHNAMGKFRVRTRAELRVALGEWDFSEWEKILSEIKKG